MSESTMQRSPLKADNRRRSSTMKEKTVALNYPEPSIPSRSVIKALYEESDDHSLDEVGLLSFEKVLLPAAAYQENQALKQLQSVVQRDHPDETYRVVACRKEVHDAIKVAMDAARKSREDRESMKEAFNKKMIEEEALQKKEMEETYDMNRESRLIALRKQHPRNQEMWREVACLITEISKLQQEERMWNQAEKMLEERAEEIEQLEGENIDSEEIMAGTEELDKVTQAIEDISLNATRIEQALDHVNQLMENTNRVRKELYRSYRHDHQFHGYQGVHDAKGLLMALSQE